MKYVLFIFAVLTSSLFGQASWMALTPNQPVVRQINSDYTFVNEYYLDVLPTGVDGLIAWDSDAVDDDDTGAQSLFAWGYGLQMNHISRTIELSSTVQTQLASFATTSALSSAISGVSLTPGPTGSPGATGAAGSPGATGATGSAGATGSQGLKGDKGDAGSTGATGSTGSAGSSGVVTATAPLTYNSGTQTVALTAVGAAGTYGRVTTDASGRVTSGKRQETYSGTTDGSGNYTVSFGTSYSVAPNIQGSLNLGTDTQTWRVTSISTTGFTILVRNRNDVLGLLPTYSNVTGANMDVLITEK